MPRNARPKAATPRKVSKRRDSDSSVSSSSLDLSSDGGYSAVDNITDSDDDDEDDVDAVEERHITSREVPTPTRQRTASPRPEQVDDDEHDADSEDADDDMDAPVDFDDNASLDNVSWNGVVSDADLFDEGNSAAPVPTERHVRFADDVLPTDSDSTESDEDEDDHTMIFPDLFVDQNQLDPLFRREIERDDDDTSSTASGTYWDFHGPMEYGAADDAEIQAMFESLEDPKPSPNASLAMFDDDPDRDYSLGTVPLGEGDDDDSLDGYETDGETTDEDGDDAPRPVVDKSKRAMEKAAKAADSDDSDAEPIKVSRGQPRLGRYKLDRSDRKPIAVVNPITRKMMIFTPHRRRQVEDEAVPELSGSLMLRDDDPFGLYGDAYRGPMLGSPAHIMLSAMYSTNSNFGEFLDGQSFGPTEAFFVPSSGEDSSDILEHDADEAEKSLDMSDFLTFDDDGSQSEADDTAADEWLGSDAVHSTPARPMTASSDFEKLSNRINASNVGAFRRDQINQRLILSEKATQDSLAFSSPYNYTALRGLKSDRFETAAVPLTPMRRQKKKVSQDLMRSPLELASQKRKASGEQHAANGHKRHRSISDVNNLQI